MPKEIGRSFVQTIAVGQIGINKIRGSKKMLKYLISLFKTLFEPDSLEEQDKDKEINYERNQWGYWK